jgi:Putative Flp pilus-assembly TadE/G-like
VRYRNQNIPGAPFISERRGERGTTILIVAAGMISMLAMLALAIDVVSLYVAEGDAQRTADAAALAGAKVFVSSGFTSGQLGDPTSGTAQGLVCNGSTGLADLEVQAVAAPNLIAGVAATSVTTSCAFPANNPQITVTVQRTGLPTLFARIWGARTIGITRSAKAEAYNPSGQSVPIQVHSVKPWLIPNCDPAHTTPTNPNCAGGAAYVFDPATNYGIANLITGSVYTFARVGFSPGGKPPSNNPAVAAGPPPQFPYYAANIPIYPPTPYCPSTNAVSCNKVGGGGSQANYLDNIACSGTFQFTSGQQIGPGQSITVDIPPGLAQATREGTDCLIHADNFGPSLLGQDNIISSAVGAPVTIAGGYNNPNSALRTATSISRSDSVVTVPVYDGAILSLNLCQSTTCDQTAQIVGFLQLGIQYVDNSGNLSAVILNAAGVNPANSGNPVRGGRVSPIPVRLIQ